MIAPLPFPLGGIDNSVNPAAKGPSGTIEADNVRGMDPRTGRITGARRPGTAKAAPTPLGASPVRGMASVPYALSHLTFEERDDPVETWTADSVSRGDAHALRIDQFGDLFILEGGTHVVVRNSDGEQSRIVPLGLGKGQVARALAIDDLRRFYVGVSEGGAQSNARIIAYLDDPYRGWIELWRVSPGMFVEKLKVVGGTLYALANDTATGRAWVIGYTDISVSAIESWRSQVPAPGTVMDVNHKGDVAVGSGFNSARGTDPRVATSGPILDPVFEAWDLEDVPGVETLRWCDIRAEDATVEGDNPVTLLEDHYGSPRKLQFVQESVGLEARYTALYGAQPLNLETISFVAAGGTASDTYRFVSTIAQKNDILIGGTLAQTLTALHTAITTGGNGTTSHEATLPSQIIVSHGLTSTTPPYLRLIAALTYPYVTVVNGSATLLVEATYTRQDRVVVTKAPMLEAVGLSGRPELKFAGESVMIAPPNGSTTAEGAESQTTIFPAYGPGLVPGNSVKFSAFIVCRPDESLLPSTLIAQAMGGSDVAYALMANVNSALATQSGSVTGGFAFIGSNIDWQFLADGAYTGQPQNFVLFEIHSYPSADPTRNLVEFVLNGTSLGTYQATNNVGTSITRIGQTSIAGADEFFSGGLSRIFVLHTYVDGQDLFSTDTYERIQGYFIHRYGMQGAFPGTHPYIYRAPPPPDGTLADFNLPDRATSGTPTLTKLAGSTHDIAWMAASDMTIGPASIGGLGSGVIWNKAGNAVYSIGPPTIISGTGADTASIRKIIDSDRLYSIDPADGAWSADLAAGSPTVQTESFSYEKLELDIDQFDNVYIPFHADQYGGPHLAFMAFDEDGTLLVEPESADQSLSFSIAVQRPFADFTTANPPIRIAAQVVTAGRREATVDYEIPQQPTAGDTLTLSGTFGGALITETYTYVATLTGVPNEILIDATDHFGTIANLVAALNHTAGEGTTYGTGTIRSVLVSAAAPRGTNIMLVARRYEGPTMAASSTVSLPLSSDVFQLSTDTVRQIEMVDEVFSTGGGIAYAQTAVSGDTLSKFASDYNQPVPGGIGAVSASARYIHSCALQGHIYTTDGTAIWDFDPRANTLERLKAEGEGAVPSRALILEAWRARLIGTAIQGYPYSIRGSHVGQPKNWNTEPPVFTGLQAFDTPSTRTGDLPVIVNGFIPYVDDLAIVLCDPGVYRVTGDPAPGANGLIEPVSTSLGGAFGRAWAIGPVGEVYFWSTEGRLIVMAPGGLPQQASSRRVDRAFEDIDLSKFYVRMAWDWRRDGLLIAFCPYGGVTENGMLWFWEQATGAFWPESRSAAGHTPSDLLVMDAEKPQDRRVLIGCKDGQVRVHDDDAVDDDGSPIYWRVLLGPISWADPRFEAKMSTAQFILDGQAGDVTVEVYVSETASSKGTRRKVGLLRPGLNAPLSLRCAGGYIWLMLSGTRAFAYQMGNALVEQGSYRRVRAHA